MFENWQLPPIDFQSISANNSGAPRSFSQMTPDKRIRACYQHTAFKDGNGEGAFQNKKMKHFHLQLIHVPDPKYPCSGYLPFWA